MYLHITESNISNMADLEALGHYFPMETQNKQLETNQSNFTGALEISQRSTKEQPNRHLMQGKKKKKTHL